MQISASFCQNGIKYSTSVPNNPNYHEDFKTTSQLEDCHLSMKEVVEKVSIGLFPVLSHVHEAQFRLFLVKLSESRLIELAFVQDIKDNSVMIYMKGVPDMPRCGFSSLAVRVLKVYGIFSILTMLPFLCDNFIIRANNMNLHVLLGNSHKN